MSTQDSISSYKNFSKAVPPQLSQQVLTALYEARVSKSSNHPSAVSSPLPLRPSPADAEFHAIPQTSKIPRPTPFNRLLDDYSTAQELTMQPTSQIMINSDSSLKQEEKFGYSYNYDYSPFRSQSSTHSSHPAALASRPTDSSVNNLKNVRPNPPNSSSQALPNRTGDENSTTSFVEQVTALSSSNSQSSQPPERNPASPTSNQSSDKLAINSTEKLKPPLPSGKTIPKNPSSSAQNKLKGIGSLHQPEYSIPRRMYEQARIQIQPGYIGPFDPRMSDGMMRHDLRSVLGDYHRGQEVTLLYKSAEKTQTRRTSLPTRSTSSGATKPKENSEVGFIKVSFVRPQFSMNQDAINRAAKFIPCKTSKKHDYGYKGVEISIRNMEGEEGKSGERAFSFIGSGLNGAKGDAESILGKLRSVTMRVPCDLADGRYMMATSWVENVGRDEGLEGAYTLVQICGGLPLEQPENPSFSRFDERYTYAWQPEEKEELRRGLEVEGSRATSELCDGEWDYSGELGSGDGQGKGTNAGDMQPAKHKWEVNEEPQRRKLRGMVKGAMRRMGVLARRDGDVDKSERLSRGRFGRGRSLSTSPHVCMMKE